jgi:thiamine-phosphate pyrophosphorylase
LTRSGTLKGFPIPPATTPLGKAQLRQRDRVPRLYIITDRAATGGRPLAEVVAAALDGARRGGLRGDEVAVQLREKDLGGLALRRLAAALREVTRAAGVPLFVNDRVDVALAVNADGVHLTGASLRPPDVRAIAPSLAIAVSSHGPNDLEGLQGLAAFAVFGPIRDTPSKRAYGPPLGLEPLRAGATRGVPLLALGGLTVGDVPEIRAAGARGLACIRAIMSAPDPAAAAATLARALAAPLD